MVANAKRAVICSGKIYYDLFEEREKRGIKDIALIRLEQFYPFPSEILGAELSKYKNAEIFWCQEEHRNMGGWNFVNEQIEHVLINSDNVCKRPSVIARPLSSSPATGYAALHAKQHLDILSSVFS